MSTEDIHNEPSEGENTPEEASQPEEVTAVKPPKKERKSSAKKSAGKEAEPPKKEAVLYAEPKASGPATFTKTNGTIVRRF